MNHRINRLSLAITLALTLSLLLTSLGSAAVWIGQQDGTPMPTEPPGDISTPTDSPVVTEPPVVTEAPTEPPVPTDTPTPVETAVVTPTLTITPTETLAPTETPTPEVTEVVIPTETVTPVDTITPTVTVTPTATLVPTAAPTEAPTPAPTPPPPTIASDLADYPPGGLVTLTGENWQTEKTVRIVVEDYYGASWRRDVIVTVQEDGTISDHFQLPDWFVSTYAVVVFGQDSGAMATMTFTDSGNLTYSPKTQNLSTTPGGTPVSFTQTVTAPRNNGNFTASLQVAGTGTNPMPEAWVSTSPTTLSFSTGSSPGGTDDPKSWIVSFTVPSEATCGDYTAQIKANPSIPGVGMASGTSVILTVTGCVTNHTPTVKANNQAFSEGTATSYSASWNDLDAGQTHTCTIDFGDGGGPQSAIVAPAQPSTSGTCSASHTYADGPNSYTITVSVSDGTASGSETATATVNNLAPTGTFSSPDVNEGSQISLSLIGASDPSSVDTAEGFTYAFDCGSGYGAFSGTNTASCPTTDNGIRFVGGKIKDEDGGVTEYTDSVTINNVAPTIALSGATNVDEGSLYTLNLGVVTDPGTDTVSSYVIHWGDGASDTFSGVPSGSKTHTYADGPNSYTIMVDLTDEDGSFANAGSQAVTVDNVAPTVTLSGPASANEGQTMSYTFTTSDPGQDTFSVVSQSCGLNGALSNALFSSATGAGSFDCTFPDGPSSPEVSVQVKDSDDAVSNTGSITVDVANVAPAVTTLTIGGGTGTACMAGNAVTLDFGFSDPGTSDAPWAVDINWGDGNHTTYNAASQGTQSQQSHTYAVGSYTITVSVTDKDGGTGSKSSEANAVLHLYNMTGILAPFNADGTSVWKYGSTLPVKVKITDCSGSPVPGLAPKVGTSLVSSSDPSIPIDETPSTSAADATGIMRYTDGQYIYNFGSKYLSDPNATYYMTVKGTDSGGNIVTNPGIVQVKFGLKTK